MDFLRRQVKKGIPLFCWIRYTELFSWIRQTDLLCWIRQIELFCWIWQTELFQICGFNTIGVSPFHPKTKKIHPFNSIIFLCFKVFQDFLNSRRWRRSKIKKEVLSTLFQMPSVILNYVIIYNNRPKKSFLKHVSKLTVICVGTLVTCVEALIKVVLFTFASCTRHSSLLRLHVLILSSVLASFLLHCMFFHLSFYLTIKGLTKCVCVHPFYFALIDFSVVSYLNS